MKNMKKTFLALFLIPAALWAQDYDYSPAINRNLEMLFDGYLIPYNKIINIDPNSSPIDTFGLVEVYRDANGNFLNGRETYEGNITTNWNCSHSGNLNEVYIVDAQTGDSLQYEKLYFDANRKDTLTEIYMDTAGTGNLVKVQDLRLFYNNFGIDSASVTVPGGGVGNEVIYMFRRNSVGKLDSLIIGITFAGTPYPIQTLIYHENVNGSLDSINLMNNLSDEIEEQVRTKVDGNGLVYEFSFYEKDMNDEWSIYDTYILSTETFFSLVEGAKAFDFELYPNPAQKQIRLDLKQNANYRIYHLSGTLFQEGEYIRGNAIDIENLPAGIYVMNVELANGDNSSLRFVKQ